MIKRILIIILLLFICVTATVYGENGEATVSVDKSSYETGDIAIVKVNVKEVNGIRGIEINLNYDGEFLVPIDTTFSKGGLMDNIDFQPVINEVKLNENKGVFMGTVLRGSNEFQNTGELIHLRFKALKEGNTSITMSKVKIIDKELEEISLSVKGTELNIYKTSSNNKERTTYNQVGNSENVSILGDNVDNFTITSSVIPNNLNNNLIQASNVYDITYNTNRNGNRSKLPQEIQLSIGYNDVRPEEEENLGIYYFDEAKQKWVYIGGDVDKATKTVKVNANHLTKFAVFINTSMKPLKDMGDHWSNVYVKRLMVMEVIDGYDDGSFYPDRKVTRAEFTKMIVKALDLDIEDGESNFSDKAMIQDWSRIYINTALRNNIMSGYGDESFKPNKAMTRSEIAVALGRLLLENEMNNLEVNCTDKNQIPSWAMEGIRKCSSVGIINGYEDNTIRPNNPITRAEAAKMIYMTLWELGI